MTTVYWYMYVYSVDECSHVHVLYTVCMTVDCTCLLCAHAWFELTIGKRNVILFN